MNIKLNLKCNSNSSEADDHKKMCFWGPYMSVFQQTYQQAEGVLIVLHTVVIYQTIPWYFHLRLTLHCQHYHPSCLALTCSSKSRMLQMWTLSNTQLSWMQRSLFLKLNILSCIPLTKFLFLESLFWKYQTLLLDLNINSTSSVIIHDGPGFKSSVLNISRKNPLISLTSFQEVVCYHSKLLLKFQRKWHPV